MKYRWRREEEETRQMYDMVERIVGKEMVDTFMCFHCQDGPLKRFRFWEHARWKISTVKGEIYLNIM